MTVEQYVAEVGQDLLRGITSRDPVTRDELEAVVEAYPDDAFRWIPNEKSRESMGLPAHFGRKVEPWGELEQERYLQTLVADETFRSAARTVLGDER